MILSWHPRSRHCDAAAARPDQHARLDQSVYDGVELESTLPEVCATDLAVLEDQFVDDRPQPDDDVLVDSVYNLALSQGQ